MEHRVQDYKGVETCEIFHILSPKILKVKKKKIKAVNTN